MAFVLATGYLRFASLLRAQERSWEWNVDPEGWAINSGPNVV